MQKTILGFAAAFAMAIPGFSMAALVTGTTNYTYDNAYSFRVSDLTYDANNSAYSDLPVLMLCIDHATKPPFDITSQFDTKAGASAIKGKSGAAGEAAIYWLLDQYFESYFKSGDPNLQRALQYALWEIGNDYDGTAASIDINGGASQPTSIDDITLYGGTDQAAYVAAYKALYAAMKDKLPTLPKTYRSTTYTMDLFRNQDPDYQNMVALIERAPPPVSTPTTKPTPVPGLGQGALMALMSLLALFGATRLRRRPH